MRAKQMNPDLKWLAMNVSEWGGSAQHGYAYIIFDGYEVDYAKRAGENRFTFEQWHDARIQLGLEGQQQKKKCRIEPDAIIAAVCGIAVTLSILLTGGFV